MDKTEEFMFDEQYQTEVDQVIENDRLRLEKNEVDFMPGGPIDNKYPTAESIRQRILVNNYSEAKSYLDEIFDQLGRLRTHQLTCSFEELNDPEKTNVVQLILSTLSNKGFKVQFIPAKSVNDPREPGACYPAKFVIDL